MTRPGDLHIHVGNTGVDTNISVSDGKWHYLAVSWESENGVLVLYKDGEKVFSRSDFCTGHKLSQATTAALVLGVYGDNRLEGSLGQVSVWSKVLSRGAVKRLMEKPLTGEESQLVRAWVHGGNRAYDLSQKQNHGNLYGDPAAERIGKLSGNSRPVRLLVGGAGQDIRNFTGCRVPDDYA
ncbi:LamG-like jellyroll fold domain-containing protein, partial [Candidatus Thiosymbion oneisti]|uniref:LamG-like jellyroll fold domain-containing protein n=1 Tax=Candidatus Thiosymbion oneisti TaxID=589554 RepID=UPI001FB7692C